MKLIVVGAGQGGSNIADEFVSMGEWVWENRGIRIFTGSDQDPISKGVFAINLGAGDLYGLKHIPQTSEHTVLMGNSDEFRGRGAGKINANGAEQARKDSKKIISTIRDFGDVPGADAILVIATAAGGTGSGSIGVIVDELKQNFNKPVYAMVVLPFAYQYDDPDTMVNTGTCLKRVLENSLADAVFLIDNQKFVRSNDTTSSNYGEINSRIAQSFMDVLCVGEEIDQRFVGEVLDANDLITMLHGPTAIGVGQASIPVKQQSGFFSKFYQKNEVTDHFSNSKIQMERAKNVLTRTLADLSIDCEHREESNTIYDAQYVLGLFSAPSGETTQEIIEMMDSNLAEQAPGAGRRKGTYPGRTSETISITVIMSNLGKGAAMDKVEFFYRSAVDAIAAKEDQQGARNQLWNQTNRVAAQLPNL
jgi:cell division GTPase FtsZ